MAAIAVDAIARPSSGRSSLRMHSLRVVGPAWALQSWPATPVKVLNDRIANQSQTRHRRRFHLASPGPALPPGFSRAAALGRTRTTQRCLPDPCEDRPNRMLTLPCYLQRRHDRAAITSAVVGAWRLGWL